MLSKFNNRESEANRIMSNSAISEVRAHASAYTKLKATYDLSISTQLLRFRIPLKPYVTDLIDLKKKVMQRERNQLLIMND